MSVEYWDSYRLDEQKVLGIALADVFYMETYRHVYYGKNGMVT
jgi:hypothetical protein